MNSTSGSNFVSPLSHEKTRDEPETCLVSHHPIGGETETTGGRREAQPTLELTLTPAPGRWAAPP